MKEPNLRQVKIYHLISKQRSSSFKNIKVTEAEPFQIFENNPKKTMFYLLYNFMNDCKTEGKRGDQFKAIESIAKMYNLFSDGNITNNQLNQIVINAPDVNSAINSIHALVNHQQITTKKQW